MGCSTHIDEVISIEETTNLDDCLALCINNADCTAVTWYSIIDVFQNACFLLHSCTDTAPCKSCESGRLTCFHGSSSTSSHASTVTTAGPPTPSTIHPTQPTLTSEEVSTTRPMSSTAPPTASTTTLTTAEDSTTSSSNLPPECGNYKLLDDSTRNVNEGYGFYCDSMEEYTSPDWQGANWYRIMPPAGTAIPGSYLKITWFI